MEQVEGLPFPIGEKLNYRISWGRIPVGAAEITTSWNTDEKGRKMVAIRSRARSNRVIRRLYPVDSRLETLVCPETLLPVRFTKNQREGRRRSHEITEFDYDAEIAIIHDMLDEKSKEVPLQGKTLDLLSFMYFVRGETFKPGTTTEHRVLTDDKVYDLQINTISRERVRTACGKNWNAFLLVPEAAFEGLFVRRGRMELWVSEENPIRILRADVEVPVARVRLILDPEADVDQQD